MKANLCSALSLTLVSAGTLPAQPAYFTRITEGPIAIDAQRSWGCALVDYDNDGLVDVFVATSWGGTNDLYHNEGGFAFSKVTTEPVVRPFGDFSAGVFADYDNDGDVDLFVSRFQPDSNCFFRNDLGAGNPTLFTQITSGAWVNTPAASVGAAWGDYDNDGFIDLAIANSGSANQSEFLYRNDGAGGMLPVNAPPLTSSGGRSQNCSWADYDNDGDLDLFVANSFDQRNSLFRNEGGGTFTRVTNGPIVTTPGDWDAPAWADFDNDGDLDLFVSQAGWPDKNDVLHQNNGDGTFTSVDYDLENTLAGICWGDFDNDGYLDLFVGSYGGSASHLLHNQRNGTFVPIYDGEVVTDPGYAEGCAWADFDNDGFLDLFVANGADAGLPGVTNYLYRNDAKANGNTNGWLLVRLVGTVSNRSAIGTKVRLKTTLWGKEVWQMREISGGSGLCSQNDLRAHFGIGDATNVTTLRIEWPSGIVQELQNVPAKQMLTITEPARLVPLGPREFQIRCWRGMQFQVQKSHNLLAWDSLGMVTNLTGTLTFQDTQGDPQTAACFYRVVSR